MDLKQASLLLDKINSLYKGINTDEGRMAAIERDLMLSYIRQLYEVFLSSSDGVPKHYSTPVETVSHTPEPAPRRQAPPKIIEIPEQDKQYTPPRPEPIPPTEPEVVKETPKAAIPAQPTAGKQISKADLESLFHFSQAKELSEKLSERPVPDLTKAMAINDRLLYINDLFNKDQTAFGESLSLLNKFGSMDEAKSLLINLAGQYDWADEEKADTARAFVKLVRRRYI